MEIEINTEKDVILQENKIIDEKEKEECQKIIDDFYKNDSCKPVCCEIEGLGKILINKIPEDYLDKKILVMSDLGILMALCEQNKSTKNITFVAHSEAIKEFVEELGLKVIYIPYEKLNLFFGMEGEYNYLKNMKFDAIIGNPPYNGIKKEKVPQEFHKFCISGYQTYFPFIALCTTLLKEKGILSYIVPAKWLSDNQSISLREELFKCGKLSYLEVIPQPTEWKGVKTGLCSIFTFEQGCSEHNKNVYVIDGRIPNLMYEIDSQILRKIFETGENSKRIKVFRGSFGGDGDIDINTTSLICCIYGQVKHGTTKISNDWQQHINNAIVNNEKFLIYPDFQYKPFKASDKDSLKLKTQVQAIDPMPIHNTLVVVPTKTPEKTLKFLESKLAKFVWTMFYSQLHYAKSLTDTLPDFQPLINDNFTDQDLYDLVGLNKEEIDRVEQNAKEYGKYL